MEKEFTTIVPIASSRIIGDVDKLIIDRLKELYEKKCFNDYYITNIKSISHRGYITFPNNAYNGVGRVDVVFRANYLKLQSGDPIALTITFIEGNSIICDQPELTAHVERKNIHFAPQVGMQFVGVISEIEYKNDKMVMTAIQFVMPNIVQICRVDPEEESEIIAEATELAIKRVNELLKGNIAKFLKIFHKSGKSLTTGCERVELNKKPKTPASLFIIDPMEPLENCVYFSSSDEKRFANVPHFFEMNLVVCKPNFTNLLQLL